MSLRSQDFVFQEFLLFRYFIIKMVLWFEKLETISNVQNIPHEAAKSPDCYNSSINCYYRMMLLTSTSIPSVIKIT